jgi:hypothetical protein
MLATIHPSYLLRIRDDRDKTAQYRLFIHDLRRPRARAEVSFSTLDATFRIRRRW